MTTAELTTVGADLRSKIARAAETFPVKAETILVVDNETLVIAGTMIREVRSTRNQLAEWMDPQIENAMETKRAAEKARKGLVDDKELLDGPLRKAEGILATRIGDYQDEEARRLKVEAERIQKELDAKAVEDALATAVALEAEAAQTTSPEAKAAILAEAEAILEEPATAPTVTLETSAPKIKGLARPEQWSAELTSLSTLMKAWLDGKLDRVLGKELTDRIGEAIMPSLNTRARALKSALNIPGVRAVMEKGHRMR